MKCVFEDMEVEILEDKVVENVNYDIKDDKLISKKVLHSTISSSIYNYDDGYSLYLKFDESGLQRIVMPMLAIYASQQEKQLGSFSDSSELSIKRYGNNFLVIMNDYINNQGSLTFVMVKENNEVSQVVLNYTQLVNFEIIEERYIVVNACETLNQKEKIWVAGVYNLSGKPLKLYVDKKYKNDTVFCAQTIIYKKTRKMVLFEKIKNGNSRRLGLFDLKIKVPIEKMKNTKKKSKFDWLKKLLFRKNKNADTIKKLKQENKEKKEELDKLKEKVKNQKIKLMKSYEQVQKLAGKDFKNSDEFMAIFEDDDISLKDEKVENQNRIKKSLSKDNKKKQHNSNASKQKNKNNDSSLKDTKNKVISTKNKNSKQTNKKLNDNKETLKSKNLQTSSQKKSLKGKNEFQNDKNLNENIKIKERGQMLESTKQDSDNSDDFSSNIQVNNINDNQSSKTLKDSKNINSPKQNLLDGKNNSLNEEYNIDEKSIIDKENKIEEESKIGLEIEDNQNVNYNKNVEDATTTGVEDSTIKKNIDSVLPTSLKQNKKYKKINNMIVEDIINE